MAPPAVKQEVKLQDVKQVTEITRRSRNEFLDSFLYEDRSSFTWCEDVLVLVHVELQQLNSAGDTEATKRNITALIFGKVLFLIVIK